MGNSFSNSDSSNTSNNTSSDNSSSEKGYKSHKELLTSNWYNTIKNKLKDNSLCIRSETELDNLINSLGDEKIFLDRYLNLKEIYNDENLQQITKDLQELNILQENNFTPSEEEGRNLINSLLQHRRKSDKFNVYLFISKLSNGRSDSPYLRFLGKHVLRNKYGMFHVGLEVDGIVLDWGTGDAGPHLIYPKIYVNRIYDKIAYIRVNYDSNFSREFNQSTNRFSQFWNILCHIFSDSLSIISTMYRMLLTFVTNIGVIPSQKLQIIAQKCVFWNRFIFYDPLNRNCQHFIDEMLKALGLEFHPEGEFKKFLDRIINYADDSFLFQEIEFLSRQDLDQYANQNWDKIQNIWDKKLLLCYSDMMEGLYVNDKNPKWGPMENKMRWEQREYELRTH
ncbi:15500_t:CDS:1 [Dentiscutata heterogama]|uniref:15500_t:CDS:1 n=1 Tax=Dentiscutata heterogama TaxID=1316150 RepID=A0ACA9K5M8_9GLOM|nr:15500_t:CDS:1 [Dentiscutata heterogama]